MNKVKKVLIIGGGFGGVAAARLVSELKDTKVTLIEKSSSLGAGVRTNFYGGHPYTFGPRHFLTHNKEVFKYLNKIVPMRSCGEHEFITYVEQDNQFYNYPLHVSDLEKMPDKKKIKKELSQKKELNIKNSKNMEDYWINSIGKTLYGKTIEKYNKKMWLVNDNKKIDTFKWSPKGATLKSGPRAAWDKAISAYPIKLNGYNDFFDKINKKKIKIILNSNFKVKNLKNKEFIINNKIQKFDIVISTISPDFYFNNKFGELPFIGRDFYPFILPIEHAFPKDVYFLYYPGKGKVTRCVEYKKLTRFKAKNTLIGLEVPSLSNRLYPLPIKRYQKLADDYFNLMPEGVYSAGRAGVYRWPC